jgi:hypothetical protein
MEELGSDPKLSHVIARAIGLDIPTTVRACADEVHTTHHYALRWRGRW